MLHTSHSRGFVSPSWSHFAYLGNKSFEFRSSKYPYIHKSIDAFQLPVNLILYIHFHQLGHLLRDWDCTTVNKSCLLQIERRKQWFDNTKLESWVIPCYMLRWIFYIHPFYGSMPLHLNVMNSAGIRKKRKWQQELYFSF